MGLFDNFKKRNKARKERNIRRETLRRAASGDQSDYVKKQMQKYGTSLEDFKANPDEVGTGILAGSPGFTPSGPRTADQFIEQQNRIGQLQKELRGIIDQKGTGLSTVAGAGGTSPYQDAIRQFKDRGELAQQAFKQELPNPFIKAAQGIGSFIQGGGVLGLLMRAFGDQNKQVNVANQTFRSPQDMENLTDPEGAGIQTSDPSGFTYNDQTGQFERSSGVQMPTKFTSTTSPENMYGLYQRSIAPSSNYSAGLIPELTPFEMYQMRSMAQERGGFQNPTTMGLANYGSDVTNPVGTAIMNQVGVDPNLFDKFGIGVKRPAMPVNPINPFFGKVPGMNMGGDVMMERTMDPTYAKLKVFNDTAYE